VSGGVLKPDVDANRDLYGRRVSAREVLSGSTKTPVEASAFTTALKREQHAVAER
jgi:lipid-binding SYLF domain-containing protein